MSSAFKDVCLNSLSCSLQETDQLLVHLQSFSTNAIFYKVPEGIKKGIPLLYMPPYSDTPVLAQKFDTKSVEFTHHPSIIIITIIYSTTASQIQNEYQAKCRIKTTKQQT